MARLILAFVAAFACIAYGVSAQNTALEIQVSGGLGLPFRRVRPCGANNPTCTGGVGL